MQMFICLEGVDAVGKTAVGTYLAQQLGAAYYKSPGGKFAAARKMVDEDVDPLTRYFFYRSACQYDSGSIRSILNEKPVVCDRYIWSTIAFHAAMDERILRLVELTGILIPDFTFVLAASDDVRMTRLQRRSDMTHLENNPRLQRKADAIFRTFGHPLIDTSKTSVAEAAQHIQQLIGGSNVTKA